MMVHLPPSTIDQLKNASSANVEVLYGIAIMVGAAFTPYGPKYIANENVRRTPENSLIHQVRLIRSRIIYVGIGCLVLGKPCNTRQKIRAAGYVPSGPKQVAVSASAPAVHLRP
jgi:hypothetical protein